MKVDKITIWNMALGWIGSRVIAAEHEKTFEAVQCALYWDNARRQALRDYPWNFAQRRAWLAEVPMPEGWGQEYKLAYALPEGMLRAHKVLQGGTSEARFVLGTDGASNKLLFTNAEKALLRYTVDVEDTSLFDDLFCTMLARKLACLIAVPILKNNPQKVQELDALYQAAIPNAMEADAAEGEEADKPDSWLMARGGHWGN